MTELKALIFDVDGTLADTERDGHRVAFNLAFTEAGLDWHWSEKLYEELLSVAGGKERIQYYLEKYRSDYLNQKNVSREIARLHQLKTQHYRQLLNGGAIPLRPGVKRLINEARERDLRLGIATTSALPNAMMLLERSLDPNWFEIIAAGDIVAEKKPAPDIYDYVLKQMNLLPINCLVLEDSFHGLKAATSAGLKTIVTVNDYTKNQDFSQASLVLSDLGEPDRSFRVLQGNLGEATYLNVDLLQNLMVKLN
jgi:HAD superfamily hydrolase (TIGR01509 family)